MSADRRHKKTRGFFRDVYRLAIFAVFVDDILSVARPCAPPDSAARRTISSVYRDLCSWNLFNLQTKKDYFRLVQTSVYDTITTALF